jgi:hypothetical protein
MTSGVTWTISTLAVHGGKPARAFQKFEFVKQFENSIKME